MQKRRLKNLSQHQKRQKQRLKAPNKRNPLLERKCFLRSREKQLKVHPLARLLTQVIDVHHKGSKRKRRASERSDTGDEVGTESASRPTTTGSVGSATLVGGTIHKKQRA